MMIIASTFDDFRRRVLAPEQLDDPSKFFDADFFDEIPLYSRYEQIEPFLRRGRSADAVLLDMALEYLVDVCNTAKSRRGFFAAITIRRDDDAKHLVPCIFVCKGRSRRLLGGLRLRKPLTAFGKHIASLLRSAGADADFGILEDTLSVPGVARLFISLPEMFEQLVRVGADKASNGSPAAQQR